MNYTLANCFRSAFAVLVLTAFFCTSALAGFPPGGVNCGAECCQPPDHRAAGEARVRLASVQAMTCCGPAAGQPCGLQAPANARRQDAIQAIQPACPAGTGAAAQRLGTRVHDPHTGWAAFTQRLVSPEARPIYLQLQSILI